MALQLTQRNAVFHAISSVGLEPTDFAWWDRGLAGFVPFEGVQDVLIHRPTGSHFQFIYASNGPWAAHLELGIGRPTETLRTDDWQATIVELHSWLRVVKEEFEAPDLWAELERERQALARPSEGGEAENTPFSLDEMKILAAQMEALKVYVGRSEELNAHQQVEVIARLDYLLEAAARGTPRIDWWHLAVGALVNLVLTSVVEPHVVQSLLTMAAHGLSALFGGGPPLLEPPRLA